VGLLGLTASLIGWFVLGDRALESYFFAYLYFLDLTIGCLALLALHYQVGGSWAAVTRRLLEAATRLFPLLAVLVVPVVFGAGVLFPWAHPAWVAADPILRHKQPYLNLPFFVGRVAVYFASWWGLSHFLNRWSLEYDRHQDFALLLKRRRLGAVTLLVLAITVTLAWIDWVMSLEGHWYSTIFGMLVGVGQLYVGLAFITALFTTLAHDEPLRSLSGPRIFNDLGNLSLTFVLGWAYLAFVELLVVWTGNLPDETIWYFHRIRNGWKSVSMLLAGAHFAVPFLASLFKPITRSRTRLRVLAAWMLGAHLIDVYWMVLPSFQARFSLAWTDLTAVLGIGGVWFATYLWQVSRYPVVPVLDPQRLRVLHAALSETGR
jgi:hypothetical protein